MNCPGCGRFECHGCNNPNNFSYYIVDIKDSTDPGSSHSSYEEAIQILKEENNSNLHICGGHLGFDHIAANFQLG